MDNQEHLDKLRHSAAHLLAAAIVDLWPNSKLAIGPAIENGFYYDVDFGSEKIGEENLQKIEDRMHELVKKWVDFKRFEISKEEALDEYKNNEFKCELIEEFSSSDQKLTIFQSGEFRDLCRGGHIENPSEELKFFKLLSVAGAYWRGDEKNQMLTRIYGTAFTTRDELDNHVKTIEIARENDHRILGKKLDLFAFSDLVGKGLVMYTPKGTIVKNELQRAVLEACKEFGAQEVCIPHMAKIELYKTSGHADKFEAELFTVKSHHKEEFVLKPVNCPHHTQIYASRPRSYKDLPISYVESTQQHRDEKPGSIGGLNRTRSFEIDDGHTFCTVDQIKSEAINLIKAIEKFYLGLGMWGKHWVSLSFRDKSTPDKYIGENSDWENAENMILEINDELNLGGQIKEGEAAIYGPKIDIMLKDSLGNDRQLGTVQIDFAMPKRFGLTYIDAEGKEKTPVMIHRAILGSYGRFIANLLENTGGAFPVWLSPVQVIILPLADRHIAYAEEVALIIKSNNIRVEIDRSSETLGNKIRKAQEEKIPYMLILGDKEMEAKKVALRLRSEKDEGQLDLDTIIARIRDKIESKSLEL